MERQAGGKKDEKCYKQETVAIFLRVQILYIEQYYKYFRFLVLD